MIRKFVVGLVSAAALATVSVAEAGGPTAYFQNSLGFIYDIIGGNGALGDGEHEPTDRSDACDWCWELYVDEDYFSSSTTTFALSGREMRIGPVEMSGLEVSRRVFVPTDANFARYLQILHNPTAGPITVDVEVSGELGSDSSTYLRATSSEDLILDTDDDWMITSDDEPEDGDPVVIHVWQGDNAARRVDDVYLDDDNDDSFYWRWSELEVPAGGTVVLVNVGALALNVADAIAIAEEVHSGAVCSLILKGMTGAEIAAAVNWDFSDEDEDGLPDCWESSYGFNPANNNAGSDPDGDGLTNLEEFQAGLDPTNPDSDGDGLSDGDEVDVYDTDPLNPDSDGDGIPDGAEASIGLDPNANQFFASDKVMVTSGNGVRQSDIAVDGTGQVHVTWVENDGEGEGPQGGGDFHVWYRLYSAAGAPLMDAEMVSFMPGAAPSIAVDSTGQAYIAWHNGPSGGAWVARQGEAVPEGAYAPQVELPGVLLSEQGQRVRIAVDGDGNIHAVWREAVEEEYWGIGYAKLDGDGEFLVEPTVLIEYADTHMSLNMALDADGSPHIVWTDDEYECCNDAVYYAMVDGSDGSLLIGRTRITPFQGEASLAAGDGEQRHSDLVVDASGRVHIVWSEGAGNGEIPAVGGVSSAEIYYARLDPSLRNMDEPTADVGDLLTVAPKLLTTDNGLPSYNSTISIDADGNLMLLWTGDVEENFDEDRAQAQGQGALNVGSTGRLGPLMVQRFDLSGNAVSPVMTLYATDDRNSYVAYPYPRGSGGWATWVEGTGAAFIQDTTAPDAPAAPNGQATVTASAGTVVLTETVATTVLPAGAQASVPSGMVFPDGLVRVVVTNLTPGASVTLTITFPSAIPDNASYYKWNTNDGWVPFAFTRTANPNQVVLTLQDGAAGDADGVANGVISDPGGWAIPGGPAPAPVTSSGSGGGGGCAMTTSPRAFDPLLPLLLILALAGLMRRRSRVQEG